MHSNMVTVTEVHNMGMVIHIPMAMHITPMDIRTITTLKLT